MPAPEEMVLSPGRGSRRYFRDLWDYREIFYFLSWRDVLVRYKQTSLGVAWSVLRPALTLIAFSLVFGRLAHLPSEGVPYPLFVFAALLPWQLFSSGLTECSSSLIVNTPLLTKVYFPRLIIPASVLLVVLLDFGISLVLFAGLAAVQGFAPDWHLLLLPFFLALGLAFTFGVGLWFAALNVKFRDFRYVVPFVAQLGLYVSPVGFSSALVPGRFRLLYALNPMVSVIDGFRFSLLRGQTALDPRELAVAALIALAVCWSALRYFRSTERMLADVI